MQTIKEENTNPLWKFHSCSLESVCRTFIFFLKTRDVMNPTYNTCATWLGYNFSNYTEDDIQAVWDNYLKYYDC